jgi:hypothetical protein
MTSFVHNHYQLEYIDGLFSVHMGNVRAALSRQCQSDRKENAFGIALPSRNWPCNATHEKSQNLLILSMLSAMSFPQSGLHC